jgi:rhodanese-related sulfurtransferase
MTNTAPERIPIPELQKKLESARKPIVIDVREPKEVAESGSIPGAQHIPMNSVENRMGDFSKGSEIVFY